jgi:hypothetical protein
MSNRNAPFYRQARSLLRKAKYTRSFYDSPTEPEGLLVPLFGLLTNALYFVKFVMALCTACTVL